MNEWQKKNESVMYTQAKLRCMSLFRYGKSRNEVLEEIQNSFYTKAVVKLIAENIDEIEEKSASTRKKRIKFPGFQ